MIFPLVMTTHGLEAVSQLKRRRTHDSYALVGDWVCEGERLGMEIEAIGGMAIERVTHDGAT